MIQAKRIYEPPERNDGFRVLVDRLWPRGISKEKARIDLWLRDVAPSDALRKWFAHNPKKWAGFQKKYRAELKARPTEVQRIKQLEKENSLVTLLYSAHDDEHNQAVALRRFLEGKA